MAEAHLASGFTLTTEQIAKAARHLLDTRDLLVGQVTGLSPLQWCFKPTSDHWSIAENLEHLVLIEDRIHTLIGNLNNASGAESAGNRSEMDDLILVEIPKRSTKVKAPEAIRPEGRWTGPEALQRLLAAREQTIQLLSSPLLRGRVRPHPIFGPMDGYQWLLATGSHTLRHIEQIREIKAQPMFPESSEEPAPSSSSPRRPQTGLPT